jgi:hypothetical protein
MRLLLLTATGLAGSTALKQALAGGAISKVIAPTRRPLAPQNKLVNPVSLRFDELAPRMKSWDVDAVVCASGTTKAKAGSQEASFANDDRARHDMRKARSKRLRARPRLLMSAIVHSIDCAGFD